MFSNWAFFKPLERPWNLDIENRFTFSIWRYETSYGQRSSQNLISNHKNIWNKDENTFNWNNVWYTIKKNAKKHKDRPGCSCEQREPKGHRTMRVQEANRRVQNFREPSVNPTWVFQLRLVTGGCGSTGTPNINQSLGNWSQRHRKECRTQFQSLQKRLHAILEH